MIELTMKQLEIFHAVVVAGSITKAARRIDLSQPSVSQQLAKFEAAIGCSLMTRNRSGTIKLTAAGEYWSNACVDILGRVGTHVDEHTRRFGGDQLSLNLGLTPALRGRFVAAAAGIASRQPGLSKFEVTYAITNGELIEKLRLHKINCAVVSQESVTNDRGMFSITPLVEDRLVWLVPASVAQADIEAVLRGEKLANLPEALRHFVDMDSENGLRNASYEWYRSMLSEATPTFGSSSYSIAADLVAAGMATAHCPTSLLAELPATVRAAIRPVRIDTIVQKLVLVVPKHLMSLGAYAKTFREIIQFCLTDYADEISVMDGEALLVA